MLRHEAGSPFALLFTIKLPFKTWGGRYFKLFRFYLEKVCKLKLVAITIWNLCIKLPRGR